ncbi:uncharacterized protein [Palaemon carinicauda]|uniref:uncharacterized protein n=1 Tax=Palaemon carinicauda TaxID=392227 RepID=UPI0035B63774
MRRRRRRYYSGVRLEETLFLTMLWPFLCSRSWTSRKMMSNRANWTLVVILVLIQLVPSSCTVGQKCNPKRLGTCEENEICVVAASPEDSVCKCRDGFVENEVTKKCETPKPPPEPSKSHLALGLGLAILFFLLFVVATLVALHYKFGLLSGMCDRLPRFHLFGRSGRDFSMVDNEEDDVNPIV